MCSCNFLLLIPGELLKYNLVREGMVSKIDSFIKITIEYSLWFVGQGELLLVFQTLAIYVDSQGKKSRDREIMYPAQPTYISI
jgi:hypothetical protein